MRTCARAPVFIVQPLLQACMCLVSIFVCVHACFWLRESVCSYLCTHECDCVWARFCAPVRACSSVCIVQVLLQAWMCFVPIFANVHACSCLLVSVLTLVHTGMCRSECVGVSV